MWSNAYCYLGCYFNLAVKISNQVGSTGGSRCDGGRPGLFYHVRTSLLLRKRTRYIVLVRVHRVYQPPGGIHPYPP
jgi:hypothetical protein